MMKNLTIRLALLIVCALSINTTFAQNVRQKPIIKKQTTATTKKQTPASTKKQTSTKQAAKKQSSVSTKQKQTTTANTTKKQTITTTTRLSKTAQLLGNLLLHPMGTIDLNMLDKTSYSSLEAAIMRAYDTKPHTVKGKKVWVDEENNPTAAAMTYHGLPFDCFVLNAPDTYFWRYFVYSFEIKKQDMTMGMYDYLDLIVSDLQELGIPMSYEKKNETYLKAEGRCEVDDKTRIKISVEEYSFFMMYEITIMIVN